MNDIDAERSLRSAQVTWYGQAGFRIEAAWLTSQVAPAYAIPMHYEALATNTGNPGLFTTQVHNNNTPTAVLIPPEPNP